MGSMRTPVRLRLFRLGLAAFLVGVVTAPSRAADPVDWPGACYCRASGTLRCTAGLTLRVCQKQCDHELCDEWFWKERLPCWNWGYGG
jgi:hypothetical protein